MSKSTFVTARVLVLVMAAATACIDEPAPAEAVTHEQAQASIIDALPRQLQAMLAFQDQMRKLWEDHILWTRQFIVSVAHGLPDAGPTAQRLLANQVDIGNTFRRFYGDAVADHLTQLLTDHILIAAQLLTAAKAGDSAGVEAANAAWIANADQIAGLWAQINPRAWPLDEMKDHMHTHLTLTLAEAVARLNGDFAGDIAKYDEVHAAILEMADMLSLGIIQQFPRKFP
ncbi:MAG TPA: hypothetical protein VFK02_19300 [Kofleriaceae bacterium]|nr:hypothetical protein [Kofleriaceae bacterium]